MSEMTILADRLNRRQGFVHRSRGRNDCALIAQDGGQEVTRIRLILDYQHPDISQAECLFFTPLQLARRQAFPPAWQAARS